MKRQNRVLQFFILFIFFIPALQSQNSSDISKLITGKFYRVILFDETEITGKIISVDSAKVVIEAINKNTIIIPTDNILYYSSKLSPSEYKAMLSLMGGFSLFSGYSYDYYNGGNSSIGPNFNASVTFFFSDTKAGKIDAGLTYLKASNDQYIYPAIYPEYQTTYTGGNLMLYSLKFSLLYGKFSPDDKFIYYGSIGLGLHLTKQGDLTSSYRTRSTDTSQWINNTYTTSFQVQASLLGSLGGSFGYRFSKSFGIKADIEYDLITGQNGYSFFNIRSYFPFRIGVFYVF